MPDGKKITGENTSKIKKDKKGKDYALARYNTTSGVSKGDTIRPGKAPIVKTKHGNYIMGGDYKAKALGNKNYKITGEVSPNKASTGYTPYTPFKMKAADYDNSPMKKNFGVGEKESPKELDSPNKFSFRSIRRITDMVRNKAKERRDAVMAQQEAQGQAKQQAAMANEAGAGGMDAGPQAEANMAAQQDPSAGGEGAVPQHGDEAHTGGAGPQGAGPRPKGPFGGIFNVMGARKGKVAMPKPRSKGLFGNLFSDIRLKENITKTGVSKSGIPTYEFNYIGCTEKYSGAMAQDLLAIKPDAVSLDASGYYKVNYNDIDVDMHLINN